MVFLPSKDYREKFFLPKVLDTPSESWYDAHMNPNNCTCPECAEIHAEFIAHFGRFPEMTHDDAIALAERRISNEKSWERALRP